MTADSVPAFLAQLRRWAAEQPAVHAVALVGSHARGEARADSDVDLILLVEAPEHHFAERRWVDTFGRPTDQAIEYYGTVRSLRVHYASGLEVEFGFTSVEWAKSPIDPGTQQVIAAGMWVLYERTPLLSPLLGRRRTPTIQSRLGSEAHYRTGLLFRSTGGQS